MERAIFLIGFMGAGKTSFGKRLAKKMGRTFLDSDGEIERLTNSSIPQLFGEIGEVGFRKLETHWLSGLEGAPIVALGGGTPCFNDNMNLIQEKGITIYLSLSAKLLADRLLVAKAKRPLLEPYKNDPAALLNFIAETLEKRTPFYQAANITFEGHNISAKRINDLVERLNANDAHIV